MANPDCILAKSSILEGGKVFLKLATTCVSQIAVDSRVWSTVLVVFRLDYSDLLFPSKAAR